MDDAATAQFVGAAAAADGPLHGLATFAGVPNADRRRALEAAGVSVLAPLQGNAYRVRVDGKKLDLAAARALSLRHLTQLRAEDRLAPDLEAGRYDRFIVRHADGKARNYVLESGPAAAVRIVLRVHPGVSDERSRALLQAHGASGIRKQSADTWLAQISQGALYTLAEEDVVQWIERGAPPLLPENDNARGAMKVNEIQKFTGRRIPRSGLGGRGVAVGVFDLGISDHPDLKSRIRRADPPQPDFHGTYVAGIIGGDGRSCCTNERSKWRGMAPLATLIDIPRGQPFGPNGADPDVHLRFIESFGMDLSNHSYDLDDRGVYDEHNRARDELIRGDAAAVHDAAVPPARIPARLHVYSAGNATTRSLYTLTKQLKNGLIVGGWNGAEKRMPDWQSYGPTTDGRIKPDVLAAGYNAVSTQCCMFEDTRYITSPGTSGAAAAATGVVALMIEQYRKTPGRAAAQSLPLPATLRGIVIHTANDRRNSTDNPGAPAPTAGPDFVSGWGLIDAQAAVRVLANRTYIEGALTQTCAEAEFRFDVPVGTRALRVTLAWDDKPSDPSSDPTMPKLVNDLDLIVQDPNGSRHLPWQLDQEFVDAGNAVLSEPACGTDITVKRKLMPDAAAADTLPVAKRGAPDHLNNVEVVDVTSDDPLPAGRWTARVVGFRVVDRQSFAVVADAPLSSH